MKCNFHGRSLYYYNSMYSLTFLSNKLYFKTLCLPLPMLFQQEICIHLTCTANKITKNVLLLSSDQQTCLSPQPTSKALHRVKLFVYRLQKRVYVATVISVKLFSLLVSRWVCLSRLLEECRCVSLSVGEVIIKTIESRRSRREL